MIKLTTGYCPKETAIKDQGFFVIADGRTLLAFALAGIPGGGGQCGRGPAVAGPGPG